VAMILCACGAAGGTARTVVPPTMSDLLRALPSDAPVVIAVDATKLKQSVLAQHVWKRISGIPAVAATLADPCMDGFADTNLVAIGAPASLAQVMAINQGLSRAALDRCRQTPDYRRLVASQHMEWRVWQDYEAIADQTSATQMLWVGPRLVVMTHGPTLKQWSSDVLWVIGQRIGLRDAKGPLDDAKTQHQLLDLRLDRSAPIWGVLNGTPTGVAMTFSIHVTEIADVQVQLVTSSPEVASELARLLGKKLDEQRQLAEMDVGFALANGNQVTLAIRMSERQVWDWIVKEAVPLNLKQSNH
jgi:hypothetical protein